MKTKKTLFPGLVVASSSIPTFKDKVDIWVIRRVMLLYTGKREESLPPTADVIEATAQY
jgi:hypothetical protein